MPEDPSPDDASALNQGRTFVWHELYTTGIEGTADFYSKVLGFGSVEYDMGPLGTYHMLTRDGVAICGVTPISQTPSGSTVPPQWATYIAVDDVDDRVSKCQAHGGTLLDGPMDIPNVGRMAFVSDPNGATFWLFKPER